MIAEITSAERDEHRAPECSGIGGTELSTQVVSNPANSVDDITQAPPLSQESSMEMCNCMYLCLVTSFHTTFDIIFLLRPYSRGNLFQ